MLSEEDAAKDARWSGEAAELARTLCRVADELKGRDVRALQVDAFVSWTRVMVFVTVTNRPQLLAMCAKMESAALEEHGCTLFSGHKPGGSTWELLDFGDVVVQIQSAEQRAYYNIVRGVLGAGSRELRGACLVVGDRQVCASVLRY